jgi:hypothetical protein
MPEGTVNVPEALKVCCKTYPKLEATPLLAELAADCPFA